MIGYMIGLVCRYLMIGYMIGLVCRYLMIGYMIGLVCRYLMICLYDLISLQVSHHIVIALVSHDIVYIHICLILFF